MGRVNALLRGNAGCGRWWPVAGGGWMPNNERLELTCLWLAKQAFTDNSLITSPAR